jgi:hypothetical protein
MKITSIVKKGLDLLHLTPYIQIGVNGYLKEKGWFRSFTRKEAIDVSNSAIPWFTYPAIYFLQSRLKDSFEVFEYGSGNSTIWLSKKVKSVYSVEYDMSWYKKINNIMPSNVKLIYKDLDYNGKYVNSIAEFNNKYDIVIVDGRDRVNAAIISLNYLKNDGVIIFDNADRDEYKEAYTYMADKGFKRIDFEGMTPAVHVRSITSIFYRPENCLQI